MVLKGAGSNAGACALTTCHVSTNQRGPHFPVQTHCLGSSGDSPRSHPRGHM